MGTHRSLRSVGQRAVRVVATIALVAGTTLAATALTASTPASAAPPPSPPASTQIQTQQYTSPGAEGYFVPAGAANITIVAQGGSGQNGSSIPHASGGGGSGVAGVTIHAHIEIGVNSPFHVGDNLRVFVGGRGGNNAGSDCRGGDGGSGNEVGVSGGQGGQCSYVKDLTNGQYLAIAAGGGGGGGQGGGGGGGGGGGRGGAQARQAFSSTTVGADGQGGAQGSSGAGGGGPDTTSCLGSLTANGGGGGQSAPTASDGGGGGGGGGGCGGGGGGGWSFEGGGGGAGGSSASPANTTIGKDNPHQDPNLGSGFGIAGGGEDGSVVIYASPGIDHTQHHAITQPGEDADRDTIEYVANGDSPIQVPGNAVSMQWILIGAGGQTVSDVRTSSTTTGVGGPGAVVFGTAPVDFVHVAPGDYVTGTVGATVAPRGLPPNECQGGYGGQAFSDSTNTLVDGGSGGGCTEVAARPDAHSLGHPGSGPVLAAAGGGGGGSVNFDGGAAGASHGDGGQGEGGGAGGTCSGQSSIAIGSSGADASDFSGFPKQAGGGGGGGCGPGVGGSDARSITEIRTGAGGGAGSYEPNDASTSDATYHGIYGRQDGVLEVFFTLGSTPTFTSPTNATFLEGQPSSFTIATAGTWQFDLQPRITGCPQPDGSLYCEPPISFPNAQPPPKFTLTPNGAPLPPGLTYTDNGDGTATIAGTPGPGTRGFYGFLVEASNGVAKRDSVDGHLSPFPVRQNFFLTVQAAPTFTSVANATFVAGGQPFQNLPFNVTTSAFPAATMTEFTGPGETGLPSGITFTAHNNNNPPDGTATLSGIPASGTRGDYTFTLKADNFVTPAAVQHFTLTVQNSPVFTSDNVGAFTQGVASSFLVTTQGLPTPSLDATAGPTGTGLPPGVTFTDNNNGTGTISGVPQTNGVFTFQLAAINVLGTAVQNFTLTVQGAPIFVSPNSLTYNGSGDFVFPVRTQALPTASLSIDAATPLPSGLTFTDKHDGTGNLTGTAPIATGTSTFTIIATNTFGGSDHTTTQSFTFTAQGVPTFLSADHADFTVGQAGVNGTGGQPFAIAVSANPPISDPCGGCGLSLNLVSGDALPNGLVLNYDRNTDGNMGTISGTPAAGTSGVYTLALQARNSSGVTTQTFTLRVFGPPAITSGNSATFRTDKVNTFNVTANGEPYPTFSMGAGAPAGVSLVNDGLGHARLTGTPPDADVGQTFTFNITASNGNAPPATQLFSLKVVGGPVSLMLQPGDQSNLVGTGQAYSAIGVDRLGESLGDLRDETTFTITDGTCSANFCNSTKAGDHTVTGTDGPATGTAILRMAAGDLVRLVLSPDPATVKTGTPQTYTVHGFDIFDNDLGSFSGSALNTLRIDGVDCDKASLSCTPASDGAHTVTATRGTGGGSATLNSFTPVTLAQGPASAHTTYGTPYSGNLTVTNGSGVVTWADPTGDTSSVTVGLDGSVSAPGTLPVGTYTVTGTNSTPRGDTGTWTFALTVDPATLTVTASDAGTKYGGPAPTSTPQYSGFVNGENESVLTQQAACSVDYTVGEPSGSYPNATHCTGGSAPNYSLNQVSGTLTVFAVQLTVTASTGSGPYGSTPAAITPGYSGFVNGDDASDLSPQPTCDIQPASHSNVGVYTTSCSGAVDPNYGFNYVPGTYTVIAVPLTITAPSPSILQGDPVPTTFTPTYTGLTNGDTHPQTPPTCTTTATTGAPLGTYPITCVGAVDGNYVISYQAGVLSIVGQPTTAALSLSPAVVGQPFTATATVAPVNPGTPPTGSVSFYAGFVSLSNPGTLLGTAPVNASTPDQAILNIPHALPGEVITAVYNGDSTYAGSTSAPQAVAPMGCTQTFTGPVSGPLQIKSGLVCVTNATVSGSINVSRAGVLYLVNSSLASLTTHGTATICGSTLSSVSAAGSTGLVVVGDPREGCAPNSFSGSMNFSGNRHGLVVLDNTYGGNLKTRSNSGPGPLPGDTAPIIQGNRKV